MSTKHSTKHQDGDGGWTEITTTEYDDGTSKTVEKDISERNLLYDGKVISVTKTDEDGNSRTERY